MAGTGDDAGRDAGRDAEGDARREARRRAALRTGRRLYLLRERKAYTQQELAEASGVGRSLIAEAELGKRLPRPSSLRSLAAALGVGVEELTSAIRDPGDWQAGGLE